MGFFDNIKRLTQPINDADDDSFEGAEESFKTPAEINRSKASLNFERSFGGAAAASAAPVRAEEEPAEGDEGDDISTQSLFGNLKFKKRPKASFARGGVGSEDILVFSPKNLNEMLGLRRYLEARVSVILKLDGLADGIDRRMLDFASGMAYGLNGKLSPISGKTFLVSPSDVNLIDQTASMETDEKYF